MKGKRHRVGFSDLFGSSSTPSKRGAISTCSRATSFNLRDGAERSNFLNSQPTKSIREPNYATPIRRTGFCRDHQPEQQRISTFPLSPTSSCRTPRFRGGPDARRAAGTSPGTCCWAASRAVTSPKRRSDMPTLLRQTSSSQKWSDRGRDGRRSRSAG